MKKRSIIFTIVASVIAAGVTAGVVTKTLNNKNIEYSYGSQTNSGDGFKFTGTPTTQNILPDFTQAAEKGVKSVVNVDVIKRVEVRSSRDTQMDMFEYLFGVPGQRQQSPRNNEPQFREQRGGGSGVIISEDGYIITNNHVIEEADQIKVTTNSGEYHTAKVIGTDPATDIALLKIDAKGLAALSFGNSDDLRLGEWVLAIGNPYGLTSTVTQGIISAKGRSVGMSQHSRLEIESFIQTDAVVNPGNSGGALITLDGSLVGINTMIFSETGSYAGYSFAVPSSIVRKTVSDLREFGVAQRAVLGIQMGEITPEWLEKFGSELGVKERSGIYIGEVTENGAAAAAGIKVGDILISIDNQPIKTAAEVQEAISKHRPNDKIKITVKRDSQVKHFDVTLRNKSGNTEVVTKPAFDLSKELGAQFREITDKQKSELKIKHGIQVTGLNPQGVMARSRVKVGFIVTSINDTPISRTSQLETMNVTSIETIEGVYPNGIRATYAAIKK